MLVTEITAQSIDEALKKQLEQLKKYSVKNIPAAGVLAKDLPDSHQLSFPEA